MKKSIRYFDPRAIDPGYPNGREMNIIASTDGELTATMTAITNPDRQIPQDSITVHDISGDISGLGIDAGQIRAWRDEEFTLIDKYQLPLLYASLAPEKQTELAIYRKTWLKAPETMVIPERPEWMV